MKIKTYLGLKELDKVFENIPDEVRIKIKEESSIDDVLKLLERYEKPIKLLQEYLRLKRYKRKNAYILNRIKYLEASILSMKNKNRWSNEYLFELRSKKLERYYLREEFIESLKGYTREPYKWRKKK